MTKLITATKFTTPLNRDAVARDWSARGYSCHEFVDPPGQEWNDFVHETDEYVVVAEGQLAMRVGDAQFTAGPGDLVRIPRLARHSLKTLSPEGSVWLYGYGSWDDDRNDGGGVTASR